MKICEECKEEFCTGTCVIFQYDSYEVICSDQSGIKHLDNVQRNVRDVEDGDSNTEDGAKKKKKRAKSAKKKKA